MTPELSAYCEQQLTRVRESGALALLASGSELRDSLPAVLAASDFVCASLARDPNLARWLIDPARVPAVLAPGEMAQRLAAALAGAADQAGFMTALRLQRER